MKNPSLQYEQQLWNLGKSLIAGLDEVGRGCLAGPVVMAAVIFEPRKAKKLFSTHLSEVKDSKQLSPKKREQFAKIIRNEALCFAITREENTAIDTLGMAKAVHQAFRTAVFSLPTSPDHILIDAFYIKELNKAIQTPIIKGDEKSFFIASASIIAKVFRDELMQKTHLENPDLHPYRLDKNKGYGTKEHINAILKHGYSYFHRKSFKLKILSHC
ncbi:MAG: ribonuclease HII [Patescibacteria group bacterium]